MAAREHPVGAAVSFYVASSEKIGSPDMESVACVHRGLASDGSSESQIVMLVPKRIRRV